MTRPPLLALVATLTLAASAPAETTRVSVAGDAPKNGIFDPSVEFAPISFQLGDHPALFAIAGAASSAPSRKTPPRPRRPLNFRRARPHRSGAA